MSWWDQYGIDKPYPEIKVKEKNLYYATLLQDDYAGYVSEFTAVNQYLYHHYYFEEVDEDLGNMLKGISIVEMRHMEMLAELIIKLGGDPRFGGYMSTNCHYWQGNFVGYGTNVCDRLVIDMKAEQDAIKTYTHHIQLIDDPYIDAILARIILDEQFHLKLFDQAYQKYCTGHMKDT